MLRKSVMDGGKTKPTGMGLFIATENYSHVIQNNTFQFLGLVLNKDIHHKDAVILSFIFFRTPCFWHKLLRSHYVRMM